MIITTIGTAYLLQNGVLFVIGARYKNLPPIVKGNIIIAGAPLTLHDLTIAIIAPVTLIALALFLKYSRTGFSIRAVEQNRDAALLVGVDVSRVYLLTFIVGSALAAVAGAFIGGRSFITPEMGGDPLIRAFTVVMLGGVGSLTGTVLGAYFVGMLEAFSVFILGVYWAPTILYVVLIFMLLFRPQGLLGRTQ